MTIPAIATPPGCAWWDVVCQGKSTIGGAVSAAANDSVQQLANDVLQGFGKAIASIGTMWVAVPTPVLTAGAGTTKALGTPPGSEAFTTILNYVTYIGLTIAVLSIIGLGAMLAIRSRRGESFRHLGALGIVFIAILLISAASALVGALLGKTAPEGSSSTVGFLQNSLWYYVGGLAILSIIIGGIRMAWEQRAQPGKDLLQALITLIVVSGTGLAVIALAVTAADAFSVWILNGATNCDISAANSTCFGTNIASMIALTSTSPIGEIGILILGGIALLMTYVQVALMVVRGGLLVILAGVLPLTASFTNTQMGKQWFTKVIGWTIAFILYKPAAALIYAAAFSLTGTNAFSKDGGGIWSILTGLALMLMALIALPALLRFVAPMTGALASGGTSGVALAGVAGGVGGDLATGAVRRFGSSASASSAGGAGVGSAPTGAAAASSGAQAAGKAASAGAASGASGAAAGGAAAAAGPAAPIVLGVKAAGDIAKAAKGAAQGAVEGSTAPAGS
jgi:hypothetical protein